MAWYLVTLKSGQSFLAERTWKDNLAENKSYYQFSRTQGKDAPILEKRAKLILPISSINFLVSSSK